MFFKKIAMVILTAEDLFKKISFRQRVLLLRCFLG